MKSEPTPRGCFEPPPSPKRLRITSIHCRYTTANVGFELHDDSESIKTVVERLVAKHDVGEVYEIDSTKLDVWVVSRCQVPSAVQASHQARHGGVQKPVGQPKLLTDLAGAGTPPTHAKPPSEPSAEARDGT